MISTYISLRVCIQIPVWPTDPTPGGDLMKGGTQNGAVPAAGKQWQGGDAIEMTRVGLESAGGDRPRVAAASAAAKPFAQTTRVVAVKAAGDGDSDSMEMDGKATVSSSKANKDLRI